MKHVLWILMTAGLFTGCKPGIPSEIIKPDKMEKVLYDIHIADGYLSTLPSSDSAKKVGAAYYDGIYKKFEIDSALYSKSMDYYYAHPEKLSLIYKNIGFTLKRQTRAMQKIDSLNNAKIINASILNSERVTDSIAINQPYGIEKAEKGLYLPRYDAIYSKNAILFNILKIKKEPVLVVKPADKPKLTPDTMAIDKNKLKLEKLEMPVEAMPAKIN